MSKSQMRAYESSPAPAWMTVFGRSILRPLGPNTCNFSQLVAGFGEDMRMYIKSKKTLCADMTYQVSGHEMDYPLLDSYTKLDSHMYFSYPEFEDRLRILRAYMDSKKPKGFRGLWRDKRDTYSYYTF